MSHIELEDLYDDDTLARIERASSTRRPDASPVRRGVAAGAVAGAVLMGVREALDPPERAVVEQIDPWAGGGSNPRVRFHWHPVPWLSVAEVLW